MLHRFLVLESAGERLQLSHTGGSPDVHVHEGYVVIVERACPPGLRHPFREPDLSEIPQGFPGPAATFDAREEPGRHRVRADEEIIAFGHGALGEPDVIRDHLGISIAAPEQRRAGIEAAVLVQREGGLQAPVTYLEEAGIADGGRSPVADDARDAGLGQRLRSSAGASAAFIWRVRSVAKAPFSRPGRSY